jgi:periplasmic protein TonB
MSVLALHQHPDRGEIRRYGAAAVAVVLLHLALISAALTWYQRQGPAGVSIPAILVDLAPAPAAPRPSPQDIAVGHAMQQADARPPEPSKAEIVEQLPPTPVRPEPVSPRTESKLKPEIRKPTRAPPAPRTTAPPRSELAAREMAGPASGTSAGAVAASYRSILASHLLRFKQYPETARASREQGTTTLSFTVTRTGRVTKSRLVRSSGFASLDRETLALIQRAQPLPAFPPEMREASDSFTVPFSFKLP